MQKRFLQHFAKFLNKQTTGQGKVHKQWLVLILKPVLPYLMVLRALSKKLAAHPAALEKRDKAIPTGLH